MQCSASCPSMLPCNPAASCLGKNKCETGYTFLQDECIVKRSKLNVASNCTVDLDCLKDSNGNFLYGSDPANAMCDYDNAAQCTKCVANKCACQTFDPFNRVGENKDEYNGERCSLCTAKQYYRGDGECVKCPQIQTYQIVIGVLFCVFGAYSVYKFTQSGVSMALASIAVDYFQVISMFSKTKVQWPPELKSLFKLLSVFNFNLDLFPPECLIKSVGFSTKWFTIHAIPLGAAALFVIYAVCKILWSACKRRSFQDEYVYTHLGPFINSSITAFYFMYMYLLRTQLDIVACTATVPEDGYVYTSFTSVECGGLCKCWVKDSLQMRILPFALIAFLIYSVGFVFILYRVLTKNKVIIMQDIILRSYKTVNPQTAWHFNYDVTKISERYSRLYYRFKPDYYWWSLVVLARKLGICFSALFYTKNPTFQFSLTLVIMFAAFVTQIRAKPYHSEKNSRKLLITHKQRYTAYRKRSEYAVDTDEYLAIHVHKIAHLHDQIEKIIQTDLSYAGRGHVVHLADLDKIHRQEAAEAAATWLMSYNTVESVLLCCGVLVCLTGIMVRVNLVIVIIIIFFHICVNINITVPKCAA